MTVPQALDMAMKYHQAGNLTQAEQLCRQILQLDPHQVDALHLLGLIAAQVGRIDLAIKYISEALRLKPHDAVAHNNLGNAFKEQGQLEEAVASYQQALRLKPNYAAAHNNLGNALEEQGQLEEAVASYQQALRLKPDLAQAHANLGNAFMEQGKLAEAVVSYQQALHLKPDFAEAHNNLGLAFQEQGQLAEAVASYQRALRLKPDFAEAHNSLGVAFKEQGKLEEAQASLQTALHLTPDSAEAHSNLGNVLHKQGQMEKAIASYQRALRLKPDDAGAHNNLLLALHYRPGVTLAELAQAFTEYDRQHAAPLRTSWQPHTNDRDPGRRLRLGFVSPDLGRHPIGYFLIRALEHLDRDHCDIVCYSSRATTDDLTARFRAAATAWYDVLRWSDDRLAQQIRADRIDLLFDMAGHTSGNRLGVFARKPAPIQLTWVGISTSGLQAMDYILADRYEIPPEAEPYYAERVLRLPDGFYCYDPPAYAPPVSPLPALACGQVTFGSFNNPSKINPQVIAVWATILQRVPGSRLVLQYKGFDDAALAGRLREGFARHSIAPARVVCRGGVPHVELLAAYHDVDLALDPFPYNGCTTTCEALWMGVPVLTCPGETFTGRHSLSHLSNVGLTELIANNLEEYVALAVSWAKDLPRLAVLRSRLREQMACSPLCDGSRFAANLLRLLRQVWHEWLAGEQGGVSASRPGDQMKG